MSSFSHLSATSHNSNNGNPKKHWRGGRPVLLRPLGSGAPGCRGHAPAPPPPAGTARKLVLRQSTKSWPARPVVGNSVLGLRKSPSVHCSKPTAPLAYGCCRRKHGGGPDTASRLATCARGRTVAHRRLLRRHSPTCYWPPVLPSDMS